MTKPIISRSRVKDYLSDFLKLQDLIDEKELIGRISLFDPLKEHISECDQVAATHGELGRNVILSVAVISTAISVNITPLEALCFLQNNGIAFEEIRLVVTRLRKVFITELVMLIQSTINHLTKCGL